MNNFLTRPNARSVKSPNRSHSKIRLLCRLGELASWHQLHTSLPCRRHCTFVTFTRSFNERRNSLRQPTLICNTFIEGHPNFRQNVFLCCWNDLLPFYRHNSFCTVFWASSFYLSVNIVLYQFTVTCIENWSVRSLGQWIIESKVYLLIIHARTEKKGLRLRLCFWVVNEVPEKNERICESRYLSSNNCLFTCLLWDFICP